jgi:hypothetical protein
MKHFLLALLCAFPAFSDRTGGVDRAALANLERSVNKRLETLYDDPYLLLGMTRSVYLENYGVVLTAELTLQNAPPITPFRPAVSEAEKQAIRKKKLERLPVLRQVMRDMLVASAKQLDRLPVTEQVVLGITLLNRSFEDVTGLPAQIVMQGDRKTLIAGQTASIKVREF